MRFSGVIGTGAKGFPVRPRSHLHGVVLPDAPGPFGCLTHCVDGIVRTHQLKSEVRRYLGRGARRHQRRPSRGLVRRGKLTSPNRHRLEILEVTGPLNDLGVCVRLYGSPRKSEAIESTLSGAVSVVSTWSTGSDSGTSSSNDGNRAFAAWITSRGK